MWSIEIFPPKDRWSDGDRPDWKRSQTGPIMYWPWSGPRWDLTGSHIPCLEEDSHIHFVYHVTMLMSGRVISGHLTPDPRGPVVRSPE